MKFPTVVTKTVHEVDGQELVDWCNNKYGADLDPTGDGDVPGDDSSGSMTVQVTYLSDTLKEVDLKSEKEKDRYSVSTSEFFEKALVENGFPHGEYILKFYWG